MVARYGNAVWDPLGTQTEPMMYDHDILCFHTMVGSLAGTRSMFKQNGYGGTESHIGLGENATQGALQWQHLMYQADANLNGNHHVTSIETADYGGVFGKWNTNDARLVPAWTTWQVNWLINFTAWWCRKETHATCPDNWRCHRYGIPCSLIPDTRPGRRGLAYHQQGCDPVRVSDGELWSKAYGKVCPSWRRVAQLKTLVIPGAQKLLAGTPTPTPTPPEEDMPLNDADKEFIRATTQLYAVANNEYVRQLSGVQTKAILAQIEEVDDETAAKVAALLDAEAKELGDRIIAEIDVPKV